ncbi:MAG: ATP-binding protein [Synechococcales bacterium]|nr:ATP-binding protein [Synechococcales bacterium]
MQDLSVEQLQQRVKELEKHNRLLQKKLDRSENNRLELENSYESQAKLVNKTIQGLEKSRAEAEGRSQELQKAFHDLQMMQAKLVESEKMSALGTLVAGIAHEINNPINFIHANISHAYQYVQDLIEVLHLYQEVYPAPVSTITDRIKELELEFVVDDLFKLLKSMQIGSDRIRDIVLGLRIFSRLDEAEYKVADLHDGLESTLMILQHRFKGDNGHPTISVIKQYGQLPKVLCFAGQLNQVFMNILVNAIDAIEELHNQQKQYKKDCHEGCITINTSATDQWVQIVIGDNGVGMTEEVNQKIFNPFYTTKSVGKGTGMGMSISYQIVVEKHGGKLDCVSQPEEGTKFTIQIPIRSDSD